MKKYIHIIYGVVFYAVLCGVGFAQSVDAAANIPPEMALGRMDISGQSSWFKMAFIFGGLFTLAAAYLIYAKKYLHDTGQRLCVLSAVVALLAFFTPDTDWVLSTPTFGHFNVISILLSFIILFTAVDIVRILCASHYRILHDAQNIRLYYSFFGILILSVTLVSFVLPDTAQNILFYTWIASMFGITGFCLMQMKQRNMIAENIVLTLVPALAGLFLAVGVTGGDNMVGITVRLLGWLCATAGLGGLIVMILKSTLSDINNVTQTEVKNSGKEFGKNTVPQNTVLQNTVPSLNDFKKYTQNAPVSSEKSSPSFEYHISDKQIIIHDGFAELLGIMSKKRTFAVHAFKAFIVRHSQDNFIENLKLTPQDYQESIYFHGIKDAYLMNKISDNGHIMVFELQQESTSDSQKTSYQSPVVKLLSEYFMDNITAETKKITQLNGHLCLVMVQVKNYDLLMLEIDMSNMRLVMDKILAKLIGKFAHLNHLVAMQCDENEIGFFFYSAQGTHIMDKMRHILISELETPMNISGQNIFIVPNIGVSAQIYEHHDVKLLKSLYEYAKKDLLYHNRTSNISDLYDMALPVGATISGLSSDLRYAPEQNQIEPYFKPIIELKTGKLVGFDVLPVWLHPDYGVIASELLMPLADYIEQTALIGRIIYIKSVERLQYWQNHHLDYQNIFIRLQVTKSSLLGQYSVYEDLMSLRQKMNFSCASIHISFGIDCIHDDTTWIKDIIRDFKLASFVTVLDDFGKSNSNLSTISDLPFDRVTLGAGYADNILKNERKYFTLRALMKMLHDLNIAVDIKNIDDISGVAVLKKLGISHISGTVSGGAISAGNVTALLKHNKTQTIR